MTEPKRLSIRWQFLASLLSIVAVITRRPDAIFNPQFYAEDGVLWYGDAYRYGWILPLASPSGGYLNTLQRLIGSFAVLFPIHFAPTVMNFCGIALQVLPVTLLLSARCAAWGPLPVRMLQAAVYLALPKNSEVNVTITNSHFHYALIFCLLAFAKPAANVWWKICDIFVFALAGVSGPFALALLPLLLFFWWRRRNRWSLVLFGVLASSSAIQFSELLRSSGRPQTPLGASLELFIRFLGGQVYLGTLVGMHGHPAEGRLWKLIFVAIVGTGLLGYCLCKASLELRLTVLFCFALFAAALRSPLLGGPEPRWLTLEQADDIRYWFFPMLGFAWSLVWCVAESKNRFVRALAFFAALLMARGMVRSWRYPAYQDVRFTASAKHFEMLPPGDLGIMPIFPNWTLRLTKMGGSCRFEPNGVVETPPEGAEVTNVMDVKGWSLASSPVTKILVYIDGRLAQSSSPNILRPDLDLSYPALPNKNKGWAMTAHLSELSSGVHELLVRAATEQGCTGTLDRISIKKLQ